MLSYPPSLIYSSHEIASLKRNKGFKIKEHIFHFKGNPLKGREWEMLCIVFGFILISSSERMRQQNFNHKSLTLFHNPARLPTFTSSTNDVRRLSTAGSRYWNRVKNILTFLHLTFSDKIWKQYWKLVAFFQIVQNISKIKTPYVVQ